MARQRSSNVAATPHKSLSRPGVFLVRMLIFLALVAFLVSILITQLKHALMTNPGLNGLIIFVFGLGVVFAFHQVTRLYREIRWVNSFRVSDPGLANSHQPTLLAPMATMLRDRTGTLSLSTVSMRSIMDSIGTRLDEARDTGRYLVGLLVFLGLLGTFWGLLETIQSVGRAIDTINTGATDNVQLFGDLKASLAAPLKGMGTAFSSSLLGLAGSLVLGFLELQASHAQNRFYNELEEWLSGITELTPGSSSERYEQQLLAAIHQLSNRIGESSLGINGSGSSDEPIRDLTRGVNQLVSQMRAEQKVVREWVDEQSAQQTEVASALRDLANHMKRRG